MTEKMSDKRPVLEVRNLSVALPKGADRVHAVEKVSFTVNPGEIVCLVGESGEQCRLHRLEQEQRYSGEYDARAETGDQGVVLARQQQLRRKWAGVHQACSHHRTDEQPAEVRGDFAPGRGWAGCTRRAG
jgi:ABC-type uncharacterized transport system ATPase subunit